LVSSKEENVDVIISNIRILQLSLLGTRICDQHHAIIIRIRTVVVVIKYRYYMLPAYEVIGVLGIEIEISASSKYKKTLFIVEHIIIHITFVNHFAMKFSSHKLFSFLYPLFIVVNLYHLVILPSFSTDMTLSIHH
jgi:hypothetical protein